MSKRRTLIGWLHRTGLLNLSWTPRTLTIFAFHRIGSATFGLDAGSNGPDPDMFRAQVAWLARHARPVSESDVLQAVRGGRALPPRAVLITFDDGYKDNCEIAYPILKEMGIPALFFVPAGLIESRQLGFWDQIAYMVWTSPRSHCHFFGQRYELVSTEKARLVRELCHYYKTEPADRTREFLTEIGRELESEPPPAGLQDAELMTWRDLREMAGQGMGIGSHGLSHRILATLSPAEQVFELEESKEILEARLGREVVSLAYPAGSPGNYTDATPHIARQVGYELLFTFETGVNWRTSGAMELKRLAGPMDVAQAACGVSAPFLLGPGGYV